MNRRDPFSPVGPERASLGPGFEVGAHWPDPAAAPERSRRPGAVARFAARAAGIYRQIRPDPFWLQCSLGAFSRAL
jgi:hypothetical protein